MLSKGIYERRVSLYVLQGGEGILMCKQANKGFFIILFFKNLFFLSV